IALCIVKLLAGDEAFVCPHILSFYVIGTNKSGEPRDAVLTKGVERSANFFADLAHRFLSCISQPSGLIGIVTISPGLAASNSRACAAKSRSLKRGCFQSATKPQTIIRAGRINT